MVANKTCMYFKIENLFISFLYHKVTYGNTWCTVLCMVNKKSGISLTCEHLCNLFCRLLIIIGQEVFGILGLLLSTNNYLFIAWFKG